MGGVDTSVRTEQWHTQGRTQRLWCYQSSGQEQAHTGLEAQAAAWRRDERSRKKQASGSGAKGQAGQIPRWSECGGPCSAANCGELRWHSDRCYEVPRVNHTEQYRLPELRPYCSVGGETHQADAARERRHVPLLAEGVRPVDRCKHRLAACGVGRIVWAVASHHRPIPGDAAEVWRQSGLPLPALPSWGSARRVGKFGQDHILKLNLRNWWMSSVSISLQPLSCLSDQFTFIFWLLLPNLPLENTPQIFTGTEGEYGGNTHILTFHCTQQFSCWSRQVAGIVLWNFWISWSSHSCQKKKWVVSEKKKQMMWPQKVYLLCFHSMQATHQLN